MVEGDDMAFPTESCIKLTIFLPLACQRSTIDVPLAVDREQISRSYVDPPTCPICFNPRSLYVLKRRFPKNVMRVLVVMFRVDSTRSTVYPSFAMMQLLVLVVSTPASSFTLWSNGMG